MSTVWFQDRKRRQTTTSIGMGTRTRITRTIPPPTTTTSTTTIIITTILRKINMSNGNNKYTVGEDHELVSREYPLFPSIVMERL
jgi:hypothetical protein